MARTHDATSRSDLVRVTLPARGGFPAVCACCGGPTDRRTRVAYVLYVPGAINLHDLFKWVWFFCGPLGWLVRLVPSLPSRRAIHARLPQCPACARQGRPRVERADFDARTVTILVDRRFLTLYEAAGRRGARCDRPVPRRDRPVGRGTEPRPRGPVPG